MLVLASNAQADTRTQPRRGVVLILVLAMLSIMALLGVTFATLSGQAQVGARYYASGRNATTPETYFDFAMNQLVNDTGSAKSALRGHSLLRDAYGNDANNNGYLEALPNGAPLTITNIANTVYNLPGGKTLPALLLTTNIPFDNPAYPTIYGKRFSATAPIPPGSPPPTTNWIVRLPATPGVPSESIEVLADASANGVHVLKVLTPSILPAIPTFVLDGRFLHAFNGSGVGAAGGIPAAGNFLFNGMSLQNFGMDEDYDAPDLENWFLGAQSSDGTSITLPSFHRPGILSALDWQAQLNLSLPLTDLYNVAALQSKAKFLRPRKIDHPASGDSFPDLTPNAAGVITYDVDNDGDGTTDSVWIDLGFPAQRGPDGKLFKPLFAFMVLGLNGRLPLNTVGNLAARSYRDDPETPDNELGLPLFDHASHGGVSASEVNPKYAFRDPGLPPDYDVQMLRRILTGDFSGRTPGDFTKGNGVGVGPTAGRFGEEGLLDPYPTNNVPYVSNTTRQAANLLAGDVATMSIAFPGYPVRAGWSTPVLQPFGSANGIAVGPYYDDNFNSTDFTLNPANPESGNYYDAAGALAFAAERLRYGVLPTDPFGVGRRMAFNELPENIHPFGALFDYGRGADSKGRMGFFLHYRPPGFVLGITQLSDLTLPPLPAPAPNGDPYLSPNFFHGFESYRDPIRPVFPSPVPAAAPYGPIWHPILFGGMPYDIAPVNSNPAVPTYGAFTVGSPAAAPPWLPPLPPTAPNVPDPISLLPGGSLAWGEADQVNLYRPSNHDAPFNALDLEWLYRFKDPDFSSLDSRLGKFAYTSINPNNNNVQRATPYFDPSTPQHNRLFSVDSWDATSFAFPTDNPGNAFPNNWRWKPTDSASFPAPLVPGLPPPQPPGSDRIPQVMHRDRRINLNFPFPSEDGATVQQIVVNGQPGLQTKEPVRIQWIEATYSLLKSVLPPKAIDHPEELARLGQFVVNIVDFRDTDAVMTYWTNPDVMLTDADASHSPRAVWRTDSLARQNLVHVGMEYQPVAITEVLAYSCMRKPTSGNALSVPSPRFFIEFTNLLTRNGAFPTAANTPQDNLSNMDFKGWDIVVTREDNQSTGWARPNPLTGQLAFNWNAPNQPAVPGPQWARIGRLSPATTGTNNKLLAITADGTGAQAADYDVFGIGVDKPVTPPDSIEKKQDNSAWPGGNITTLLTANYAAMTDVTPLTDILLPPTPVVPTGAPAVAGIAPEGAYHWVFLRRPANPKLPVQDTNPNAGDYNPLVVIDSMRFPYVEAGGTIAAGTPPAVTQGKQAIWSVQRIQPYRGGQAVPNWDPNGPPPALTDQPVAAYSPATAYGYTEQCDNASDPANQGYGVYDWAKPYVLDTLNPPKNNVVTQPLYSTLGARPPGNKRESWDPVLFLDRDFESVAELMLVPTAAPGLFTKQFVEMAPPGLPLPTNATAYNDPTTKGPWLPKPGTGTPNANTLTFPFRAPPPGTGNPAVPPGGNVDPPAQADLYQEGLTLAQLAVQAYGATLGGPANVSPPHVYPYLADQFFYSGLGDASVFPENATPVVDGPSGAGWHRMLGFFEVPSSAFGAIGPVAQGVNQDWYREDNRPGLLNPNLFFDEQVFFGWLDDPRMNYAPYGVVGAPTPAVSTQLMPPYATPTSAFGFLYNDPLNIPANSNIPYIKAAWRDFLGMRHSAPGGLPLLFSANPERPFHDITYPDIMYTLLRPAGFVDTQATPASLGVKVAPTWNAGAPVPLLPAPIPPRRLFELPGLEQARTSGSPFFRTTLPTEVNLFDQVTSNATAAALVASVNGNTPPYQSNAYTAYQTFVNNLTSTSFDPVLTYRFMLGANRFTRANNPPPLGEDDLRQHPAYRIELLSKLMNLTTVRTHQYAVWVTVGLFEVVQEGSPEKAAQLGNPDLAYDKLGRELGKDQGKSTRYRMFFVVDRTRATGFNSRNPDDFRNVIVYQKRIE